MSGKNMREMTSKERMAAALRREDVDRVPIPQDFWTDTPEEERFSWDSLEEEIAWKKAFGFDPRIGLPDPWDFNPDIQQRVWQEPGERYPILCSEWTSPKGTLSSKLRKTDDYLSETVRFFGDFNTSRYIKPLFTCGADMMTFIAMDHYQTLSGDKLARWRERCRYLKQLADKEGLAVYCSGGTALDYLIWAAKAEQAIMLAIDYPEETLALLEYLNRHTEERVALCLELGVDFVIRRGWYESADFWNPQLFAQFAAPFIQREINLAHQAGVPCCYLMCTGIIPMLPELAKLDFDCLMDIEPVATGQDLRRIVEVLGDTKSFWTGVSAPLQIGRGSEEDVRRAVREAFAIFGKKGFLLSAVPSVRHHWPWWRNLTAMVDESRKLQGIEGCGIQHIGNISIN